MRENNTINQSILNLLKQEWRDDVPLFETVFAKRRDGDDRDSFYSIWSDVTSASDFSPLTYAEAKALIADGAFNDQARYTPSPSRTTRGRCTINEHAQHALVDFLQDTYRAYRLYRERLAKI